MAETTLFGTTVHTHGPWFDLSQKKMKASHTYIQEELEQGFIMLSPSSLFILLITLHKIKGK